MKDLILLNQWKSTVYHAMCQQFSTISVITIEFYLDQAADILVSKSDREFTSGMLRTIAFRNLQDFVKREKRHAAKLTIAFEQMFSTETSENRYEDAHLQKALKIAMNDLDETNRFILEQRAFSNKNYEIIAQEVGNNLTAGAARKRYSNLCHKLRCILRPYY